VDITSAKVKNEAAMAEGSNAIYNQAVRSNLLNVLITSELVSPFLVATALFTQPLTRIRSL